MQLRENRIEVNTGETTTDADTSCNINIGLNVWDIVYHLPKILNFTLFNFKLTDKNLYNSGLFK